MNTASRVNLMLAGVGASILAISNTPTHAANNFEIIIGNGPHAGTYKLAEANTTCLSVKARKQVSAAYKDTKVQDAKTISGAGINVFNPDDAGPKRGEINVRFGDPDDKRPAAYEILISRDSKDPLTMTKHGTAVELAFNGQTKNGIKLRATATCTDIDEF